MLSINGHGSWVASYFCTGSDDRLLVVGVGWQRILTSEPHATVMECLQTTWNGLRRMMRAAKTAKLVL